MNESDYLASSELPKMIDFLKGKVSDRKLRLFAVACCRSIWHLLTDPRSQAAVEAAEQFADGLITEDEMVAAWTAARSTAMDTAAGDATLAALGAVYDASNAAGATRAVANAIWAATDAAAAWAAAWCATKDTVRDAGRAATYAATTSTATYAVARATIRSAQAEVLRDIAGNPFHPVTVPPSTLTWNDRTVERLANEIYWSKSFDQLPILADALEEAGCPDDVIGHLRGPGPHHKGCWALDLVLGKEQPRREIDARLGADI